MSVCHRSIPAAMAFCFLEDLRWEFAACYHASVVSLADKPYPFLEFGKLRETTSRGILLHLFPGCHTQTAPFRS